MVVVTVFRVSERFPESCPDRMACSGRALATNASEMMDA